MGDEELKPFEGGDVGVLERHDAVALGDINDVTDEVAVFRNDVYWTFGKGVVLIEIDGVPNRTCKVHESTSGDSHTRQTILIIEEIGDTGPNLWQVEWASCRRGGHQIG